MGWGASGRRGGKWAGLGMKQAVSEGCNGTRALKVPRPAPSQA